MRNRNGAKTFYVFSGEHLLGEIDEYGTPLAAYHWVDDKLIAMRLFEGTLFMNAASPFDGGMLMESSCYPDPCETEIPQDTTYWYHFGAQGETRLMTGNSGSVVKLS